jgi:hypothetical protein
MRNEKGREKEDEKQWRNQENEVGEQEREEVEELDHYTRPVIS